MSRSYDPRAHEGAPGSVDVAGAHALAEPASPEAVPNPPRFVVREKLGRGGTGTVVRAFDREAGCDVALKSIHRAEGDALLRFKREFRALRDIRHPNLVELVELVEQGGEWLYTMEIVDGVSPLEHVRGPDGGFHEAKLRALLGDLAGGLVALHRAGMVHRDVKPSNVLVTPEGRVVLLDFGLVASARDGFQSTDVPTAGTVAYMAPEQALGMPAEPASDWYAFGVLLFEALTGRAPYEGMTLEILLAKAQRAPREPRELSPAAPEDLSRLCARLLAVDPAERPTGAEVLALLSPGAVVGDGARAEPSGIVGRARELETLRGAAARVAGGAQVSVTVEGDAGTGKSALVSALVGALRAERADVLVLRGRCDPRERIPYRGLDGVVDGLSSHLRRREATHPPLSSAVLRLSEVFPVLRRVPSVRAAPGRPRTRGAAGDEVAELSWALRVLLANVATTLPVVLVLEDAQWLDATSRDLLSEVLRPPNAPPILVVVTRRPDGTPGAGVRLAPLPSGEALAIVRAKLPDVGADADSIAREGAGNPELLAERAERAARRGGRASVADLVDERLASLAAGARDVLALLAVSTGSVPPDVLVAAAGGPPSETLRASRALVAARLAVVANDGRSMAVFHPAVAEAVRSRLGDDVVEGLHRRLAGGYVARGPRGARGAAAHLVRAGEATRAAEIASRAAEQLAREGEFAEAAELYRASIDAAPVPPGVHDARLEALGRALARAGRSDDAAAAFLEAAERAAPVDALENRRRAAEQLAFSGRFDEGQRLFADVMRALGTRYPRLGPLARLAWLSIEAWVRLRRGVRTEDPAPHDERRGVELAVLRSASTALAPPDATAGLVHVPWALRLALKLGDPAATAIALGQTATAIAFWTGARAPRTAPLLARATAIAAGTGDAFVIGTVAACEGVTRVLHGEWEPAAAAFARADETLPEDRDEALGMLRTAEATVAQCLFFLGRFEELRAHTERLLATAARRGDRYLPVRLHSAVLPMLACADDRAAEGLAAAEAAVAEWTDLGVEQRQTFLRTKVLVHAYEGRYDLARAALDARAGAERAPYRVQVLRVSMTAIEALVGLAAAATPTARAEAARVAARAAKRLEGEGAAWASAFAACVRAAGLAARDQRAEAARAFEAAAALFGSAGMKAHALACRRHAGVLDADGEPEPRVVGANSWMRERGIVRPERFASLLVPFEPSRAPSAPDGGAAALRTRGS